MRILVDQHDDTPVNSWQAPGEGRLMRCSSRCTAALSVQVPPLLASSPATGLRRIPSVHRNRRLPSSFDRRPLCQYATEWLRTLVQLFPQHSLMSAGPLTGSHSSCGRRGWMSVSSPITLRPHQKESDWKRSLISRHPTPTPSTRQLSRESLRTSPGLSGTSSRSRFRVRKHARQDTHRKSLARVSVLHSRGHRSPPGENENRGGLAGPAPQRSGGP